MNNEKKLAQHPRGDAEGAQAPDAMDEFFNRIQSEMRRPDLSQDAITEAFHAIQRIALENDTEDAVSAAPGQAASPEAGTCPNCGSLNGVEQRFCGSCGASLETGQPSPAAETARSGAPRQHFYHHHYHHHYFSAEAGGRAFQSAPAAAGAPPRESFRGRTPGTGNAQLSRAETAVRKMSQDWAQACNTKHLDDLVDLYAPDAMVLRPNLPPVRGTAALRELFFAVLDAGLGEVEFEPLRVDVMGEVAYEAGRCKMLVPVAMGKRREERGKYMMVFNRINGEWKITADTWSSDLSLSAAPQPGPSKSSPPATSTSLTRK